MFRLSIPEGTRWDALLDTVQSSLGTRAGWLQLHGRIRWVEFQATDKTRQRVENAEIVSWAGPTETSLPISASVVGKRNGQFYNGVVRNAEFGAGFAVIAPCEVIDASSGRQTTPDGSIAETPVSVAPGPFASLGGTLDSSTAPSTPPASSEGVSWAEVAAASESAKQQVVAPASSEPEVTKAPARKITKRPAKTPTELRGYDPDGRRAARQARKQRDVRPVSPTSPGTPARVPEPLPERNAPPQKGQAEHVIEKGDWVEHRVFGVCKVFGEDGDGGLIIKVPSGARKSLKTDFFQIGEPRIEGERIIYPLRRRTPGS